MAHDHAPPSVDPRPPSLPPQLAAATGGTVGGAPRPDGVRDCDEHAVRSALPTLSPPPPQSPVIPPDLLTLDVRGYTSIEDTVARVKLYLHSVRQLAIERGLGCEGQGGWIPAGPPQPLFVVVVTGGGQAGTFLRAVLQKILRNRHMHFVDRGGESFDVDALSGTMTEGGAGGPSNQANLERGGRTTDEPPPSARLQELTRLQEALLLRCSSHRAAAPARRPSSPRGEDDRRGRSPSARSLSSQARRVSNPPDVGGRDPGGPRLEGTGPEEPPRGRRSPPPPAPASDFPRQVVARRTSLLVPRQSSDDSVSEVTDASNHDRAPGIPATVPRHRSDSECNKSLERETRQAVVESQAAHIAHTRRQVIEDIRFRRAVERAANEGVEDGGAAAVGGDPHGAPPQSQQTPAEEEAQLARTVHQSLLDERDRKHEAEEKYARELEAVLRQSHELTAQRQVEEARRKDEAEEKYAHELEVALRQSQDLTAQRQEEARRKDSEEELVRDVVARSQAEAEAELRKEEELVRDAIARSLANTANDDEEQQREELLLREVVARSMAEDRVNRENMKKEEEEQIRWALAQSLGKDAFEIEDELIEEERRSSLTNWEREHIGKEDGEQLKQPASGVCLGGEAKISEDKEKEQVDKDEKEQLKKPAGSYR